MRVLRLWHGEWCGIRLRRRQRGRDIARRCGDLHQDTLAKLELSRGDDNVAVQQVNYQKLRERLLRDKQILDWPAAK